MKGVDTIIRVRRELCVRGRSIKEAAGSSMSRNAARKILRSGATAFEYKRSVRERAAATAAGLALTERLEREGVGPLCHLAVVNLRIGSVGHRLII